MSQRLTYGIRFFRVHYCRQWWLQALALLGFWLACDTAAHMLGCPLPGSIVGLLLIVLALELRWIPLRWLRRGAAGLLANLMLFLVPAMLALVDHRELFSLVGAKLLTAILLSTLLVMIGTAVLVEVGFRLSRSRT